MNRRIAIAIVCLIFMPISAISGLICYQWGLPGKGGAVALVFMFFSGTFFGLGAAYYALATSTQETK